MRACDFVDESHIIYVTDSSVHLVDLDNLEEVGKADCKDGVVAIGIKRVDQKRFVIQGKNGKLLIVQVENNHIVIVKVVETRAFGFCRISFIERGDSLWGVYVDE